MKTSFDLAREVLDHEILDCDEVSCGIVDDIALAENDDGTLSPAYLVVGVDAWRERLPALLAYVIDALVGATTVRVPWSEVQEIGETVRLRSRAATLGLGKIDRKVGRWLEKIPGA